jgi:hypothetical protein
METIIDDTVILGVFDRAVSELIVLRKAIADISAFAELTGDLEDTAIDMIAIAKTAVTKVATNAHM